MTLEQRLIVGLCATLAGCSLALDTEKFSEPPGTDLHITISNTAGGGGALYAANNLFAGVVTSQNDAQPPYNLSAVAVVVRDPRSLPSSLEIFMPRAIPDTGDSLVRVYFDLNGNGAFDVGRPNCIPPGTDAFPCDPGWEFVAPSDGRIVFDAKEEPRSLTNDPPTEVSGEMLAIQFEGMDPHIDRLFELRVFDEASTRCIGSFHIPRIVETNAAGDANFPVVLPGILVPGRTYRVDYFADHNGDLAYQDPPADHAWRDVEVAGDDGIEYTFTHNTDFAALDWELP